MLESEVMPIKKEKVSEEASHHQESSEDSTSKNLKKRKKKAGMHWKIGIKDFPLGVGVEPYDLVNDVSIQGPKLTWP